MASEPGENVLNYSMKRKLNTDWHCFGANATLQCLIDWYQRPDVHNSAPLCP